MTPMFCCAPATLPTSVIRAPKTDVPVPTPPPTDGGCDDPTDPFSPKGPGGSAGYPFSTDPSTCGGLIDLLW